MRCNIKHTLRTMFQKIMMKMFYKNIYRKFEIKSYVSLLHTGYSSIFYQFITSCLFVNFEIKLKMNICEFRQKQKKTKLHLAEIEPNIFFRKTGIVVRLFNFFFSLVHVQVCVCILFSFFKVGCAFSAFS